MSLTRSRQHPWAALRYLSVAFFLVRFHDRPELALDLIAQPVDPIGQFDHLPVLRVNFRKKAADAVHANTMLLHHEAFTASNNRTN
jgi:hypothetical protein